MVPPMIDPLAHDDRQNDQLIGRRGFIAAGLSGAAATLIAPAGAARAAARAGTRQIAPVAGTPYSQMPVRAQFPHLPAIPIDPAGTADTLARLETRAAQVVQSKQGLTKRYTLGGSTRTAYDFLYGPSAGSAGPRSLEHPAQFAIGWTTLPDVYEDGQRSLDRWTASLSDADAATRQFWPMVAEHGTGYNLLLPERVTSDRARALRRTFGAAWTSEVRASLAAGNLYVIDLSIFEGLEPQTVNGAARFTPATVTLLVRDARARTLAPVAVRVSGRDGRDGTVFARDRATDGAWLYALQAAKTSITVFGVWLGHVYHWHIVTAAMQMAMFNTLPSEHPVHQLLAPQSKFLIQFDEVLLNLWSDIAPPTSISSGTELLQLANSYAEGRSYFDDDPKVTLRRLGLREADFTDRTAWDRYPVAQRMLAVWDLVETYVAACVAASYPSDAAVAGDAGVQAWISAASASDGGNVRGLPAMDSRATLARVLTSLLYRVTVHGVARLNRTSNPALTFVGNFPHTLQRTDIPSPRARIDTKTLLTYLPNTASIGSALSFYFTFAFSTPYEPFIPLAGAGHELFFQGGRTDPRNQALIELRRGLARFIDGYQPEMPQRFQWPRNIET
jgi:hypothetical protein